METGRRRGYKELVPPEGSASPGGQAPTLDSGIRRGECLEILQEEPGGEPDSGRSRALIDITGLHEFTV